MVKKDYIEIKASKKLDPEYGPLLLRIGLGALFLVVGTGKLVSLLGEGPASGVVSMVAGIGFFAPVFWAWLLAVVEVVFGALIFLGLKSKFTVLPLIVVLIVAVLTVSKGNTLNLMKDLSILFGLLSLIFLGSGNWSLDEYLSN